LSGSVFFPEAMSESGDSQTKNFRSMMTAVPSATALTSGYRTLQTNIWIWRRYGRAPLEGSWQRIANSSDQPKAGHWPGVGKIGRRTRPIVRAKQR